MTLVNEGGFHHAKRRIAPPQLFTPKKRGYYYQVAQPHPTNKSAWDAFIATANASLDNVALPNDDPAKHLPLWVHNLTTGYSMVGTKSQGPSTAAFYPNAVVHDNLIIEGIVPNNYMYDQLVEFITRHHQYALDANRDFDGIRIGDNANGTLPLRFSLFNKEQENYHKHKKIQVSCYIPTIEAGAERFQNARTYRLELLVTNSYRDVETYTMEFAELLTRYKDRILTPYVERDQPGPTTPEIFLPGPRSNQLDPLY